MIKKISLIAVIVLFYASSLYCGDDFLTSEVTRISTKLIDNPADFLFNLHSDNVDFTPVPKDKNVTIRTNFYPTTFPTTWVNLNFKVKVLSDSGYTPWIPQVDLIGQYGKVMAIDMAASDVDSSSSSTKVSNSDMAYGLMVTKAVSETTRLFFGLCYSKMELIVDLGNNDNDDNAVSSISLSANDTFFVSGIENSLSDDKPSYVKAHLGYGLRTKKIVSRIGWYSNHFETGFNFYPEGLFVMHYFMAWHWNF